ncbi:MAG: SRPBCC family protein [Acidimicrobiia bacterium]
MTAPVQFEVRTSFAAPPRRVWDELIDWKGHEAWIPATRVEAPDGDATAVGAEFTAFTGYGPLTLEDRMRVARCTWDETTSQGDCEVEKLGPLLQGRAGFTVKPEGAGCVVVWREDVTVPYVPGFAAAAVAKVGAAGFKVGMRKLAKIVE